MDLGEVREQVEVGGRDREPPSVPAEPALHLLAM
jgi:hypothetical protein